MGLAEKVAKARFIYHAEAIEINNVLNQLGFRNNEVAEEVAKNHVMILFNDIFPRLGYDVEAFMNSKKES